MCFQSVKGVDCIVKMPNQLALNFCASKVTSLQNFLLFSDMLLLAGTMHDDQEVDYDSVVAQALADEELARKLQEELLNEGEQGRQAAADEELARKLQVLYLLHMHSGALMGHHDNHASERHRPMVFRWLFPLWLWCSAVTCSGC